MIGMYLLWSFYISACLFHLCMLSLVLVGRQTVVVEGGGRNQTAFPSAASSMRTTTRSRTHEGKNQSKTTFFPAFNGTAVFFCFTFPTCLKCSHITPTIIISRVNVLVYIYITACSFHNLFQFICPWKR